MTTKTKWIMVALVAVASVLLAVIPSLRGLASSYIEERARAGLQARVDSLQGRIDEATEKAELSRRRSDSLGVVAAESEADMRLLLGRLGPLQGRVAELERNRKELGSKEDFDNAEIKNIGRFVDSLLLYRDSVLSSLPR